jgi:SAM-dependent methyltransferase
MSDRMANETLFPPKTFTALHQFVQHGLVVDPWMAAVRAPLQLDRAQVEGQIEGLAGKLMQEAVTTADLGRIPINRQYLFNAIRETMLSSVVFESHLESGRIELNPRIAPIVGMRLESFVRAVGLSGMVLAYAVTAGTENLAAVAYYRRMREDDFISGQLHRPWISRPLDLELAMGMAAGTLRLEPADGVRMVAITARGRASLADALRLWAATGYARTRNRMLAIAAYNDMADWDELSDGVMPDLRDLRRAFLDEARIEAGSTILEVGSGTGLLTFDAGLVDRVGPDGLVLALDPSVSMTARAQAKQAAARGAPVRFVQGVVESLPFADASIDQVVSFAVLQYTQRDQALREIARVLKPGGRVALGVGLKQILFDQPFYRKWFGPLHRHGRPNDAFCAPEEIPRLARSAGLQVDRILYRQGTICLSDPVRVVRTMLQFPFYQDVLLAMPYAARMRVAEDLVGRGRFLLTRTGVSPELPAPMEWVFGSKS